MTELIPVKAPVVITADQIDSRHAGDRTGAALDALRPLVTGADARAFARQAGDEIQALLVDSAAVVAAVRELSRLGGWRIGIGVGDVDRPVPADVREANGPAFVAARAAVNASRVAPAELRVSVAPAPEPTSADRVDRVGADPDAAGQDVEAALWLLRALWGRRTAAGWEAVAATSRSESHQDAARRLGITASAFSQRLRAALYPEGEAGERLAVRLLDQLRVKIGADVAGQAGAVGGRG